MKIINYFHCDKPGHWLAKIRESDWSAGQFLYQLLNENRFKAVLGEKSILLLLTDGSELVSFCTYAQKDDIPATELGPWIGFVYTFPQYRGHRYAGQLISEAERLALADGIHTLYISTDHIGLYEKYGYTLGQIMRDGHGNPSRIYQKNLD